MGEVFVCDAVRTPIGRFGGSLAKVRTDDLAAAPIRALMARHPKLDWSEIDEVYFGCANQAGEDNRNVARMALLLAGLPTGGPGTDASIGFADRAWTRSRWAARAIRARRSIGCAIAGGVERCRALRWCYPNRTLPGRARRSSSDTTLGWRFINPLLQRTIWRRIRWRRPAENVAAEFAGIAGRSGRVRARAAQQRCAARRSRPAFSPRRSRPSRFRVGRRDLSPLSRTSILGPKPRWRV